MGARVRIVTGLSYGCPLIVHRANVHGIAELQHRDNALIAEDVDQFGDLILELIREPALAARLEENGRATYERFFALPVAGVAVETVLESIARTGSHS